MKNKAIIFKVCTYGMKTLGFNDEVSQQKRTVRYVKLRIDSFYGKAGGLRHISFGGVLAPQGIDLPMTRE